MVIQNIQETEKNYAADLSVVISTYNRVNSLIMCLEKLSNQGDNIKLEVVVVDNGSSDHTFEYLNDMIHKYPFKLIVAECNKKGPAAARNLGVKIASSEIVAFIDDDSYPEKNWAFSIYRAISAVDKQTVAVKGKTILFNKCHYSRFLQTKFDDSQSWITNNIAYKKNMFIEIGGFDEDSFSRAAWEDLDLAKRVADAGLKKSYCDFAIVQHPREKNEKQVLKKYTISGYGFYDYVRKWIKIDKKYVINLLFFKTLYLLTILKAIALRDYAQYLKVLSHYYEIKGLINGLLLKGKFKYQTKEEISEQ